MVPGLGIFLYVSQRICSKSISVSAIISSNALWKDLVCMHRIYIGARGSPHLPSFTFRRIDNNPSSRWRLFHLHRPSVCECRGGDSRFRFRRHGLCESVTVGRASGSCAGGYQGSWKRDCRAILFVGELGDKHFHLWVLKGWALALPNTYISGRLWVNYSPDDEMVIEPLCS